MNQKIELKKFEPRNLTKKFRSKNLNQTIWTKILNQKNFNPKIEPKIEPKIWNRKFEPKIWNKKLDPKILTFFYNFFKLRTRSGRNQRSRRRFAGRRIVLVAGEFDESADFKIKRRKKRAVSRKYGAFQCQVRFFLNKIRKNKF